MEYQSGEIGDIKEEMRHEVRRAWWMPLQEAAVKLSYGGEKEVARKALQFLENGPQTEPAKTKPPKKIPRRR